MSAFTVFTVIKSQFECECVCVSLKVTSQLLHAASGPVETMEGSLHQRSHNAAHVHLISTAVPLAVMFHSQPAQRGGGSSFLSSDIG